MFNVRGDGFMTVTGSLNVSGSSSFNGEAKFSSTFTASTGISVTAGGLLVRNSSVLFYAVPTSSYCSMFPNRFRGGVQLLLARL